MQENEQIRTTAAQSAPATPAKEGIAPAQGSVTAQPIAAEGIAPAQGSVTAEDTAAQESVTTPSATPFGNPGVSAAPLTTDTATEEEKGGQAVATAAETVGRILNPKNEGGRIVREDGSVEFEFGTKSGNAPAAHSMPKPKKKTPPAPKRKDDGFHLPENFAADEKYNTPQKEERPPVYTTYMPRFTEVSETYRMNNDPRPRAGSDTKKVTADPTRPDEATAELEETAAADATVVTVRSEPEKAPEGILGGVFKFPERKEEPQKAPPAEEDPVLGRAAAEEESATGKEEPETPVFTVPDRFYEPTPAPDVTAQKTAKAQEKVPAAPKASAKAEELYPPQQGNADASDTREYITYSQHDVLRDSFLDRILSLRVRLGCAAALAVLLLLFESVGIFGLHLLSYLRVEGGVSFAALIDLQFCLCLFAMALPEAVHAVRLCVKKQPTPELFLIAGLLVMTGYSLSMALAAPLSYPLFGSVYALTVLASLYGAYLRAKTDYTAFCTLSDQGEKRVVDNRLTRTMEKENIALDGAVDEYSSMTSRVFRTRFVSEFFARTEKTADRGKITVTSLLAALGAALVFGAVAYLVRGLWTSALYTAALVFELALPVAAILQTRLSYAAAARELAAEHACALGEGAFAEFAHTDVITFDESEVFTPEDISIKRILLVGERGNLTKAYRQMSALFSNVGGALDRIFADSLDRRVEPASSAEISEDGVCGLVDGKTVLAGTRDYMQRQGIFLAGEEEESTLPAATVLMYAAEDGEVYAKFYIRYSFSEEFTGLLPALKADHVTALVCSRDPNVSKKLFRALTGGADGIRVLKPGTVCPREETVYPRISAPLVATKSKPEAIAAVLLAKKYCRTEKKLSVLPLVSLAAGCVFGALLSLLPVGFAWASLLALAAALLCLLPLPVLIRRAFPGAGKKGKH